jgi:putative FmdB family regulatory protein
MPFYEYECENCKFYTELLQKVTDAPLKKCPSCGKSTMKKLVSAPVFRLKGDGWYETDFKGDKENKRNLAVEKEPDTASDSKPAKTDAKADAKADAKPAAESKPAAEAKPAAAKTASKSRAKPKPVAKAKAKPAARRKAR